MMNHTAIHCKTLRVSCLSRHRIHSMADNDAYCRVRCLVGHILKYPQPSFWKPSRRDSPKEHYVPLEDSTFISKNIFFIDAISLGLFFPGTIHRAPTNVTFVKSSWFELDNFTKVAWPISSPFFKGEDSGGVKFYSSC